MEPALLFLVREEFHSEHQAGGDRARCPGVVGGFLTREGCDLFHSGVWLEYGVQCAVSLGFGCWARC